MAKYQFRVIDAAFNSLSASSSNFSSAVMATNPKVYYRLGEPSGTTMTDQMGFANGTYVNSPTLGVTGAVTGNTAVTLNGSTQYATSGSFDLGDIFSIALYFKTTSSGTGEFWSRANGAPSAYISNGKLKLDVRGALTVVQTQKTYNDGNYHYVVYTKQGANARIYVDGIDDSTNIVSYPMANGTGNWNVGRGFDGIQYFNGTIDELAVWTYAITQYQFGQIINTYAPNPNRFNTVHVLKNSSARRLSRVFNRPGSFTFTFPLDSEDADAILTDTYMLEPYKIGIEILRDSTSIWSGYFQNFNIDYAAGTCQATVVGWQQKLAYRYAPSSLAYNSTDAADMFAAELARSNADVSDSGIRAKGALSNSYYLTSLNSDLSGGNDWNKVLSFPKDGNNDEYAFVVAGSATEDQYGFTPAGQPSNSGASGAFTIKIRAKIGPSLGIPAPGYAGSLAVAAARVNSSGVEQAITSFTAFQTLSTSYATYSFTTPSLSTTWNSGDRLKIVYRFRSDTSTNTNFTVKVGTSDPNIGSVAVPWAARTSSTYSITRYVVQRFDNYNDLLQKLTDVENGFDIDFILTRDTSVITDAPAINLFVWPSRGTDYTNKENAPVFGINCAPDNAKEMTLTIDGTTMINRAIVKGKSAVPLIQNASDSEQQRELREEVLTFSDVGSADVLNAIAASEVLIRRYAHHVYSFQPVPFIEGSGLPEPFVNYDLGDTIKLRRRRRRTDKVVNANVRIFTMDIDFGDNNEENITLGTSPP